jgi:hypothetical protein
MKVELKNLEGHDGHDSFCFRATLYVDGVKSGDVTNDGNGGCHMFDDWNVAKKLNEYAKTLPKNKFPAELGGGEYEQSADSLVDDAIDAYFKAKDEKKFKKALETMTLFTLPEDKAKGIAYRSLKAPYSEKTKSFILSKFPNATILNEGGRK